MLKADQVEMRYPGWERILQYRCQKGLAETLVNYLDTEESSTMSTLLGPSSQLDLLSIPPPSSYLQPLHPLYAIPFNSTLTSLAAAR